LSWKKSSRLMRRPRAGVSREEHAGVLQFEHQFAALSSSSRLAW
jgi:hypothetical protein